MTSLLLLFPACENPFSTRRPEPPDQNSASFVPPITPDVVFINLRLAFSERNVENYIRSLVDSTRSERRFEFIPDRAVASTQPGTFEAWTLEDERTYLANLFQAIPPDSAQALDFTLQNKNESATSATFTQNYMIVANHTRQSNNIPVLYRGQSKFWLEKDAAGNWAIYRWEDIGNGEDPSWSSLKALF